MRNTLIAITLAMAASLPAASIVTPAFLDRLAIVESGGVKPGEFVIGDNGRARGFWQMKREAWADVNRLDGRKNNWWEGTMNTALARHYATRYLQHLETLITTATGRPPTEGQLYAAYNLGFRGLSRRGFSLKRCPVKTRRAAARL